MTTKIDSDAKRARTVARYKRMLGRISDPDTLRQIGSVVEARRETALKAIQMEHGEDNLRLLKQAGRGMLVWHVGSDVRINKKEEANGKNTNGVVTHDVWHFYKNISIRVGKVYPRKKVATLVLRGRARSFTVAELSKLTLSERPWDPLREKVLSARKQALQEQQSSEE